MKALAIIGCTLGGAFLGFMGGAYKGDREGGDDFGLGILLYGGTGSLIGGLIGVVVGAILFT